MANKCKDCGCSCKRCLSSDHDVQLHVEIENLKQKLFEKENHIVSMENNFLNEANKFPNGEVVAVREELLTWQDKYRRLYDAHRRVQRVNQGLEDKLLKLVDVCETDKNTLTKDVATLSHKLAEANYTIKKLTEDNERYKTDVSLAIQFLQCKQGNFVVHKFDSLPMEVQSQVATYMTNKRPQIEKRTPPEIRSIKVPIPTFPPTAMVYSVPKSPRPDRRLIPEEDVEAPAVDIVSAAIMAKVLEERQRDRALTKHCDTCTCAKNLRIIYENNQHSIGTQTGDYKSMLCLRCNEGLSSNSMGLKVIRNQDMLSLNNESRTESQQNIVKIPPTNFLSSDSKTKSSNNSSLIDLTSNPSSSPKLITPIAPITTPKLHKSEHHHLCDKTSPSYEITTTQSEKTDSETNIDKSSPKNSDQLKGPRYCSMRVQTGTRNILLDNAHNNIRPVLYTRSHKLVKPGIAAVASSKTHLESPQPESVASSSDCRNNSILSDNSSHNQQRVAEWIQSNMEQDLSSSDNSRSDPAPPKIVDKEKYAEMEENVKRFLFGKSEFLKTVELGKTKYQNYQDDKKDVKLVSKQKALGETEI